MEEDRIGVGASAASSAACAFSSSLSLSLFFFCHMACGVLVVPTGDQKHTPCTGGTESQPLDRQGSPYMYFLN